jgi:McrBC 5-methylcytosine restriction system component
MTRSRTRPYRRTAPLAGAPRANEICLELEDHSIVRRSAIDFFQLRRTGDPQTMPARAARLAEQFVTQNRSLTSLLDVRIDRDYDGNDVRLLIQAGSAVGAIPLVSPTTARPDYGLVVQPRFPWPGIGPMLAEMGWRVSPTPLRLPLLRRSERRVPVWVLSLMILLRLKALLDSLDRRFELAKETRRTPRGTVHWAEYATRNLARAGFLSIPCTFPDLRDDRLLKGAIRHTVERQLRALETQKEHGAFVHRLMELGQQLLRQVQNVPAYVPSSTMLGMWLQRPMRTESFVSGLQAIEWTVDERGLAGLSDLEGIPWTMPMDQFFEAWVETVFRRVAQRTGGQMRAGRKRETTYPIHWDPPFMGSQKSLVPDLWLEWDSATLIVDAKYKRHWEELQRHPWANVEEQLREQHRNDLLQVLAYTNLARTPTVIACLAYPCSPRSWSSLSERGRLIHRAELTVGSRSLHLWLTAFPMAAAVEPIAASLSEQLRRLVAAVGGR